MTTIFDKLSVVPRPFYTRTMTKRDIKFWLRNRYVAYIPPIIYVIVSFTGITKRFAFVPDYLNLSKATPSDFFGLIVGAIASIIGILMAVILLTVEFSKERLVKNVNINPLDNRLIRNSLYNSVNLIGLSFVAYIEVTSFDTESNLTIGYLIGMYFLFYLYFVYPVIKEIIGKSNRIKENLELVNSLNLNAFRSVSKYRFQSGITADETLDIIKKEIDEYILANKISSYHRINDEIMSKVFNEIKEGQNRNKCEIILDALTWLWRENAKTAIRINDSHYFEMVWKSICDVYIYSAKHKIPFLHLQEIGMFIKFELLKLHTSYDISMPLTQAVDCIEMSFKANLLNNCPEQSSLKHLNRLYDKKVNITHSSDAELQWDGILDIFRTLNDIQEVAIKLSDKDLFEATTRRIESICSDLFWQENKIGDRQKSFITWRMLTSSFYQCSKAIESGLYANTLEGFHIPDYFIADLVKNDKVHIKDVKVILINLADYLILAHKEGKLFVGRGYGTLYDFCKIGIQSLQYYKENKKAKKTVNYIIKVLKKLKIQIEKKRLSKDANVYLHIKSRLQHFVDVAVEFDGFSEENNPVKSWKEEIKGFKKVSKEEEFSIVKW